MNSSGVIETGSQRWLIAAIAGITSAVFVLDIVFPLGFVVPALYLIPITITARVRHPLAPFLMAASSTGLTFAGIWTNWSLPVVSLQLGLFNRLLIVLACWMTATIIWHTKQKYATGELEAVVAARTAALRQSETTLQSFFNSTDLMMGVVEVIEDRPVMVITNRAATSAGDGTDKRSVLLPPALRWASDAPTFWMPHLEAARRTGKTVHVNYQIPLTPVTALSERIMTSAISFIGYSAEGNGLYAWIGQDVTEKMHIEQKMEANRRSLEVSQAQLRQLTAQLLSAQDDERRRIARELHDEVNQRVISLAFEIDDRLQQMPELPPAARTVLQVVKNEVVELSDHLREVAHRLHPSVLEDLGIASALRGCAHEFEQREHIPVHLTLEDFQRPLDRHLAECLFRVAQEALRNVAKHAGATTVVLALSCQDDSVMLRIEDNGRGLVPQDRNTMQRGLGLISMGERVRLMEGTLTLTSDPGSGTRLSVSIPLTGISHVETTHLTR
ncbi:MAG TPA: sensor histidine kinase [Nitrospira sp.]|nr:sensor histidine kinase [Nitrospira sp.]